MTNLWSAYGRNRLQSWSREIVINRVVCKQARMLLRRRRAADSHKRDVGRRRVLCRLLVVLMLYDCM